MATSDEAYANVSFPTTWQPSNIPQTFKKTPSPSPPMHHPNLNAVEQQGRQAAQSFLQGLKQQGAFHVSENYQMPDPFKKRKLIFNLRRRVEAFPDELKDLIPPPAHLEKLNEPELDMLLQEAKFTVATSNSTALEKMVSGELFQHAEALIVNNTPLKARGYGNALTTNIAFQKALKEWMLDNTDIFYSEPKYRAGAIALRVLWDTHEQNQLLEQHVQFMQKPLEEDEDMKAIMADFDALQACNAFLEVDEEEMDDLFC